MRRILFVALLGANACAEVETIEPPEPPQLVGAVPAVGRRLDLEVEGRGTPVRLRGVTGRVTAVCVLGTEGPAGAEPALARREAMPQPPAEAGEVAPPAPAAEREAVPQPPAERQAPLLDPAADRVLRACEDVAARLADRIAVVALTTDRDLDLDRMQMRTFRDPDGKALAESLDLPARSQVVLLDQQGRVADILPPDELHRFETAATRLVR